MAGDRSRQPVYEIFSTEIFANLSPDPLGSRRPAHTSVRWGTSLKSGYLSAVGLFSMKMVADRHRHAA